MIFKEIKNGRSKKYSKAFEVYRMYDKPSHRFGIIQWANPKIWKPNIPHFIAIGPEIMLMNSELREIADKIDEMIGGKH